MVQGTGSDVGKSLVVAGLCRAFTRRDLKVRPFKPQNMSNNAAVCVANDDGGDGGTTGEIGRAQALQARACGVAPHIDMNPVLLKPQTDVGTQVVVHGAVRGNATARDYHGWKPELLGAVLESFARLGDSADLIIAEGAGSPAEMNLRHGDIANMGFAEAADVPVVLVADISRGGVLATLVGTWTLLPDAERARVKGYIVNKFRGDVGLFDGALDIIGEHTGLRCLGVVPFWPDAARLPAEDAAGLEDSGAGVTQNAAIKIAVPRLSRIANFDDLDPLRAEDDVFVELVAPGRALPGDADLVIVPGSKATRADLDFMAAQGWDVDLAAHVRRGGHVLGICAGYQMLGRSVADPDGIEGTPGTTAGLGLLDVETTMGAAKTLRPVDGTLTVVDQPVRGFEMHMGVTTGPDTARPLVVLEGGPDGAVAADGRVMGCSVHGLFADDGARRAFLGRLNPDVRAAVHYEAQVDATLDGLADHLAAHLDLDRLLALAQGS